MSHRVKWYQWAMIIAAMALTINSQFSKILRSPSSMIFSSGGDGLKNYLTPLLHVKNSTSYNHFDSMNYPYGEHVLFTDNQPLISNLLRFFQQNFGDIAYHTTGVLNVAMLLSLFFSGILLYGIFRRLQLPHWYSVPAAVSVVWLSPQLGRMMAHYALSYMIILLLLFYFLMRFENRAWKWSLSILALTFFAPMLHFYYFGISAVYLSFFYFIKVWKDKSSLRFYAKHWAIQLLIPFAFFNLIWLNIDNSVTDRPAYPNGFLDYVAVWEGTFFNQGNWVYDFIDTYITKILRVTESESINYVGFIAFLFILVRLISWIFSRRLKMLDDAMDIPEKPFLQSAFWASVLLFIFSLGVPFIFPDCSFLLAYMGPLKQFRGLGRFSWMFFFIVNIIAFYVVYHWGERIKNVEFRRVFWLIFLVIAAREAVGNAKKLHKPISIYEELRPTGEKIEDWLPFVDANKYQAILPIPYYHLGAEYLGIEIRGNSLAYNLFPSYYGNIPSMGVMMSRTSWQQSLNSIPLGMELYREPPVFKDLPNQKPLLAIEYKKWHNETGNRYQSILSKGKKIHENQAFCLYELPLDAYRNTLAEKVAATKVEASNPRLFHHRDLLATDSLENFVYKNFDGQPSEVRYRGTGAFGFSSKEKNKVVFNSPIPFQKAGQKYKLFFWLNIAKGEHARTTFKVRELDKNQEQRFFWHHGCLHNILTLDGEWALVYVMIEAHQDDTVFEISLDNDVKNKNFIHIDELMLIPENNILYKITNEETMRDARWMR